MVLTLLLVPFLAGPLFVGPLFVDGPAANPAVSTVNIPITDDPGPFWIREIRFAGAGPDMPEERLRWERLLLSRTADGYIAVDPAHGTEWVELGALPRDWGDRTPFFSSALRQVPTAVTRAYRRLGIGAVRVTIDVASLTALRDRAGPGVLRVHIVEGVVGEVRAIVHGTVHAESPSMDNGDDVDPSRPRTAEQVRSRRLRRLLEESPVQAGDPLRLDQLHRYTSALNRVRHRRVEVSVVPGRLERELFIDYQVQESRPWTVWSQLDNTGTPETGRLRERLGLWHSNLTGADDRLSLSLVTAEFDEATAGVFEYEYPMARVPWLSARLHGLRSEYDASEVGAFNLDFEGSTTSLGLEFRGNFWQSGDWFADMVIGGQYYDIETENKTLLTRGQAELFLIRLGLIAERRDFWRQFRGRLALESSLPGVSGTDRAAVEALGRTAADDDWRALKLELQASDTLERWFASDESPAKSRAHELWVSARAQHTFGSRVPPNFTLLSGGLYSVRGYPVAFASGDTGVTASLEYRYHLARALTPAEDPGRVGPWLFRFRPEKALGDADWDLVLRSFVDVGRTENQSKLSFERDQTLLSLGLGMEWSVKQRFTARLDWGVAANAADNGTDQVSAGSSRVHFVLTLLF